MSKHSLIEVNCRDAEAMATSMMRHIEKIRQENIEQYIAREIKRRSNGFFHRLFRRPPVTREQVVAHDMVNHWGGGFIELEKLAYQRQYETCENVVRAAQTGGKLLLSLDDYRRIGG